MSTRAWPTWRRTRTCRATSCSAPCPALKALGYPDRDIAAHFLKFASVIVVLGAAIGMGMLAKYAMIYFVLCAICAAFVDRDARAMLMRPQSWLALGIAALIVAPNAYWNFAHDFVTFRHTGDNISGGGLRFRPLDAMAFFGSQFAVAGPLVFAAFLVMLARIGRLYTDRIAWVAPGLTHRSFVLGRDERAANKIVASRQVGSERLGLVGANDLLPAELRIECLPTSSHCKDAIQRLAKRLGTDPSRVGGTYSRGGTDATPLALPELLDVLIRRIKQ